MQYCRITVEQSPMPCKLLLLHHDHGIVQTCMRLKLRINSKYLPRSISFVWIAWNPAYFPHRILLLTIELSSLAIGYHLSSKGLHNTCPRSPPYPKILCRNPALLQPVFDLHLNRPSTRHSNLVPYHHSTFFSCSRASLLLIAYEDAFVIGYFVSIIVCIVVIIMDFVV